MGNTTLISGKQDTICWDDYTNTFIITFLYNYKSIAMKNTSSADYVRKYFEEQDKSSDEEETVLNDFPPFMANFRKPKINITAEDKKDWLESRMEQCKTNELLQFIIHEVFDFEKDESIIAREIFAVPEKMAIMFDYMDLFFQT